MPAYLIWSLGYTVYLSLDIYGGYINLVKRGQGYISHKSQECKFTCSFVAFLCISFVANYPKFTDIDTVEGIVFCMCWLC